MWLEEEKTELKLSSLWRYSYLLERHIYPEFGNIRIKDLTQEMVQEFAKEKRKTGSIKGSKPLSDSYVNSILVLLLDMHIYRGVSQTQAERASLQKLAAHYLRSPAEPDNTQRHFRFPRYFSEKDHHLPSLRSRNIPAEYTGI